ncbi:hypothetical protein FGG08_004847 [Glutinoglossum americanum]|uniref:DUF7779 domain-containing protein n=1 Tax=Glutinoglossum americanum TaxID=1670608 RepID=A0A9P8L3H5_9PEZI|nr:hypothetical protein FGG08_004847 [Glutinoglossum americanum]
MCSSPGCELVMEAVKRYAGEAPTVVQKRWSEEETTRKRKRRQEAAELVDGLQSPGQSMVIEMSQGSRGNPGLIQQAELPFERNGGFVGREDVIASVKSKFLSPGCNRRVALYGLGGIGLYLTGVVGRKTQIALEYTYRLRYDSPETSVFWVHGSSYSRFEQSYRGIAKAVGIRGIEDPKADLFELVNGWFRSEGRSGDWLVVLDNADDISLYFDDVRVLAGQAVTGASSGKRTLFSCLPQGSRGSILVTTRSRAAATKITGGGATIPVERMSTAEAEALLNVKLDGEPVDRGDAIRLFEESDSLPLCISQVAAFCRETGQSVSDYLEAYRSSDSDKFELLGHEFGDFARDPEVPNAVLATWVISFNRIKRQDPRAADLISLMSFFDPQRIPESLLRQRADESTTKFKSAIGILKAFSFVIVSSDNKTLNVHRLVHLSTRYWLSEHGEREKWIRIALELLSERYPHGDYQNRNTCAELLPHAQSVLSHDRVVQTHGVARSNLLCHISQYHNICGKYDNAYFEAAEALVLREEALGKEHPHTLVALSKLALVLHSQGKYVAAEEMHRRALEGKAKALGKEHPDTLITLNNLALALDGQGKYEAAEEMHRRVLEGRAKTLGKEHPSTLTSLNNLASVFHSQGKYETAEKMYRRVLEGEVKTLGKEHPDTLTTLNNLASVLGSQDKYEAAEEMHQRVLESREKVLGKEHPVTLSTLNDLASVLHSQGKYEAAEEMHRKALEGQEKAPGKEHPDTLTTLNNLASVLGSQDKYEAAGEMHQRVLESREKVLGKEHPDTLTTLNNLASVLDSQGKYEAAGEMHRRVLESREKILGMEHPDTLAGSNNLAILLHEQKR